MMATDSQSNVKRHKDKVGEAVKKKFELTVDSKLESLPRISEFIAETKKSDKNGN